MGVTAVLALTGATWAGSIGLAWNPVQGATGYRVHYGQAPGEYAHVREVGNVTNLVLDGLEDCRVYYLAVTAYAGPRESESYSTEVQGLARPRIQTLDPSVVMQGDQVTLEVRGANFEPGASLAWDAGSVPVDADGEPLLRLESVNVQSCTRLQALLTVEPMARGFRAMEIGVRDLWFEVVNPDRVFVADTRELEVRFDPTRADINRSDASTRDRVDGKDLGWLAYAYASVEGSPTFNPDADLNGDGQVDGDDLALLSPVFGSCWNGSAWDATACP